MKQVYYFIYLSISAMISLIIITLASIVYTVNCDFHNVTVRPTDSDPSVCGDHSPCDTFSNLISYSPTIFSDRSDLTLMFLKGQHTVNNFRTQLIEIEQKNVLWYGENATIVCKTGLIFIFNNTENLEIRGLNFFKCGNKIYNSVSEEPMLYNISAALFLSNVRVFHCKTVTISHSKGYGLFLFNHLSNAQISDCSFLSNNKDCKPDSHDPCVGGHVALYFLNQLQLEITINISIIYCIFEGGGYLSELPSISEYKDQYGKPFSASSFKANYSLTVIIAQISFQIHFHVTETKFSKHPAVMIYDHSEVNNKFEFVNSIFSDVSLTIFRTSRKSILSELLRIKNCSLTAPVVHICVNIPTKLSKVGCKPSFNYSSSLIIIKNSAIISSHYSWFWGPIILIEDLQMGQVFWKYETSNSTKISTVEFSECKFIYRSSFC